MPILGPSGQVVSDDAALLINRRDRHVLPNAVRMKLDRLAKELNPRGVKIKLVCVNPVCPHPAIVLVRDDTQPRGAVLRCGCTDLVFARDF